MSPDNGSEPSAIESPSDPFAWLENGRDLMLIRRELREEMSALLPAFLDGRPMAGARRLAGGRGETLSVSLRDGSRAVLRRYLRGGVPARFLRDVYLGSSPRPFAELRATEQLRRGGIDVPEPLGAIARSVAPGFYRGAMATREITASVNLWEYLRATHSQLARQAACGAAVALVDRLLAVGAIHPDLNLKNFLVSDGGDRLWLIDCDGVRFTGTSRRHRRRALDRLCRSVRRLDPEQRLVEEKWFQNL